MILATTNQMVQKVDFFENSRPNPALLVVQVKILFARIEVKLSKRKEYQTRVAEVMNSVTEIDMTIASLNAGEQQLLDVGQQQKLPDLQKDKATLEVEQRTLESFLDPALLLADYKLIRDIQARLLEHKAQVTKRFEFERSSQSSSRLSLGQRLSLGRKASPSPRRGSPAATPRSPVDDALRDIEDFSNKTVTLFRTHDMPTA